VFHLNDDIGLVSFDLLADLLDEKRGIGTVRDVDSGGPLGPAFVDETDENSHFYWVLSN
jgi:hypothetical protein